MTDCVYRNDIICLDTFDQCEECKTCEFNPENNPFNEGLEKKESMVDMEYRCPHCKNYDGLYCPEYPYIAVKRRSLKLLRILLFLNKKECSVVKGAKFALISSWKHGFIPHRDGSNGLRLYYKGMKIYPRYENARTYATMEYTVTDWDELHFCPECGKEFSFDNSDC